MDPFRTLLRLSSLEERAKEEAKEPIHVVRIYRRIWLTVTVFVWVVLTTLTALGWFFLATKVLGTPRWSWSLFLILEGIRSLNYLSPVLGYAAARKGVLESAKGTGGWVLSATPFRWALVLIPVTCVGASLLGCAPGLILESDVGTLIGFVIARLAYFGIWLRWSMARAGDVGVLLWVSEGGRRTLRLQRLHGFPYVSVRKLDAATCAVTLAESSAGASAGEVRWRSVTPLKDLAWALERRISP